MTPENSNPVVREPSPAGLIERLHELQLILFNAGQWNYEDKIISPSISMYFLSIEHK